LSLFGNKHESNLRSSLQMVEEAMGELGPDYRFETLGQETSLTWLVHKGPLEIRATLRSLEDGNYLRVVAFVAKLPPKADATFYRRLLELNGTAVTGGAFALIGDSIVLCLERTTVDLDRSEIVDAFRRIAEHAERYRDIG
jgi:hypothetical protein